MSDKFTQEQRSRLMARIKGRDTAPEKQVRQLLHRQGFRFRLHRKDLPGKPDIVLSKHRKIIFVHGCFWHGHNCPRGQRPATNCKFWNKKLGRNIERDGEVYRALHELEWSVLIIWQCEIKNIEALGKKLVAFLSEDRE